jgi:hypothetical protein
MKFLLIVTLFVSVVTAPWLTVSVPQEGVILINPKTTYQTMIGWEATDQAGQREYRAKWLKYKDQLYDLAVNDLGIDRVRLQVKATSSGFDWTGFDQCLAEVVVPLRQRLEARGERLWVNVCVVEGALKDNPSLYAQNVLATYKRMQSKYGFVPDSWEAGLEPDHFGWGTQGSTMGYAIVAAGKLLAANGYPSKVFIAPSSSNTVHAIAYFDEMVRDVPDSTRYLAEFSYHLYGGADRRSREAMAMRALSRGLKVSQGEFIGATYEDLHQDLKVAQVSSWEQYTLCWAMSSTGDNGGQYYVADDVSNPANPPIVMGSRTKFLRQYFKFIRRGAVRIGAMSSYPGFDPVAFRNVDAREVVVVKAASGGSFKIHGLSAGTYGVKYTTAKQYDVDMPAVNISPGQPLDANIPDAGVITIYGTSSPGPAATPKPIPNASFSFGRSIINEIVSEGERACLYY